MSVYGWRAENLLVFLLCAEAQEHALVLVSFSRGIDRREKFTCTWKAAEKGEIDPALTCFVPGWVNWHN